jgi:hypothetical protein
MVLLLMNCEYEVHINGSECAAYIGMQQSTSLNTVIFLLLISYVIYSLSNYYTLAALYTYPDIYLSTLLDNEATHNLTCVATFQEVQGKLN